MILRRRHITKRRFTILILSLLCAGQVVFSGCVLDSEDDGEMIYEFWTIDGRSIDYYKKNLPENMDYPTHILLENYVPGEKLRGKIKMIRLGSFNPLNMWRSTAGKRNG